MPADLEARVVALESKVRELVDIEAIRDLRFRYHEYINEAKFTEIAELFTEDGEVMFGHLGNAHGRAEINRFFGALLVKPDGAGRGKQPPLSRVRQFIHNHMVEVHGDRASGFAYLEAKPVYKGESYVVAARYDDEYVRHNGQWKFKKMALTPYFMVPLKEGWAQEDLLKMGH
ncbi:MAG TPA: nuclear transport factor 2 family protein [Candidatus Binataceae bacterium]|nr:nuclear transport factor 2 family protein [Candidatus Binataceae bacterium]